MEPLDDYWILPDSNQKEFVSKVEEIKQAEELYFEPTPSFGRYRIFFPKEAMTHPAKANTMLLEYLIKNFTQEGDTVLDPMAGTSSTIIVAALHGRNGIGVELEDKFVSWGLQAKEIVERSSTLNSKGQITIIKGDARKLSEILNQEANTIITSPPYTNQAAENLNVSKYRKGGMFAEEKLAKEKVDTIITSPPYSESPGSVYKGLGEKVENLYAEGEITKEQYQHFVGRKAYFSEGAESYPKSDGQIQGLPHGEIDTIITSPPYSEGQFDYKHGMNKYVSPNWKGRKAFLEKRKEEYSEKNITTLKHGDIDAIITSPPYAHESTASKPTRLEKQGKFKMGHSKEEPYTKENYKEWDKHQGGNIGKKKLFIRVPCKAEEAQYHDTREGRKGTIWEYTKEVEATPEIIEKIQKLKDEKKGKSETYLEAMQKVYYNMYQVLKPGGRCIIIVKPFQRNKKIIDLPWHTHILLTRCGFVLDKVYKLRLKRLSFWRILAYRKYPELPRIMHEYILVYQKPK